MEKKYCEVPEKIHTHPMEGQWKFLGGGGLKGQNDSSKVYEAKLKFPGRKGVCKTKTFHGGSMDIFWNCILTRMFFFSSRP